MTCCDAVKDTKRLRRVKRVRKYSQVLVQSLHSCRHRSGSALPCSENAIHHPAVAPMHHSAVAPMVTVLQIAISCQACNTHKSTLQDKITLQDNHAQHATLMPYY